MAGATSTGKVICFHCRRRGGGPCGAACRSHAATMPAIDRDSRDERLSARARRIGRIGLAFAGAALAGALAGALLALLGT